MKNEGLKSEKSLILSRKGKTLIMITLLLVCSAGLVFAAGDDFGINEFLGQVKTFIMAIGGGLIILSISIWAIKGITTKTVTPDGWKQLVTIFGCGVLLLVGPAIVSSVFGSLGGVNI